MSKGIDYAWANPKPSPSCLKSNGVSFIMRYFSHDSSKDLTKDELTTMNNGGISVGVVWETVADRMLSGYNGGVTDAGYARDRANSLGIGSIPIYFACDWDASEGQQAVINGYLDGAASVIGRARVGMYAGYWPLKRALDAGKCVWAWQTYAWSGGNTDPRMHVYQYHNGVTVCGTSSDWNESKTADFGQWPRPAGFTPDQPVPSDSEVWFMSDSAVDGNGKRHFVAIWDEPDRKVNYRAPGGSWVAVDPNSKARSGASIEIVDDHITITYTNVNGVCCTYDKPVNGGTWGWAAHGPDGGKVM